MDVSPGDMTAFYPPWWDLETTECCVGLEKEEVRRARVLSPEISLGKGQSMSAQGPSCLRSSSHWCPQLLAPGPRLEKGVLMTPSCSPSAWTPSLLKLEVRERGEGRAAKLLG